MVDIDLMRTNWVTRVRVGDFARGAVVKRTRRAPEPRRQHFMACIAIGRTCPDVEALAFVSGDGGAVGDDAHGAQLLDDGFRLRPRGGGGDENSRKRKG